jgi:FixJ family two-component response regulator
VIAIIDDDPSAREATQRLVRSLGHKTQVFASAEEYLESEQGQQPACVITDLHMPGMSGIDLQDRLIADGCRVPMIFVTAYFEEQVEAQAMEAGAFGFLRKPFDDESFVACLDKALNPRPAEQ